MFQQTKQRPTWYPWSETAPVNLVEAVYKGPNVRCAWCEAQGLPYISPMYRMHMPDVEFRPAHVCPICRERVNRIFKDRHTSFDLVQCRPSTRSVNIGAGYVPPVYAAWYLAAMLVTFYEPVEKPMLVRNFMLLMTIRRGVVLPQEPRKRRRSAGRKGGGVAR